ncbi:polynucleotide adenylyltransferase PcnB [Psychrobacter sp. I-STPA10]|uniref:polynucleotide adenylyltransferase PcnB n=1 Tax=Psychrobacter sp. I-STPA10 TaxID=2585769 RepID=UPI001E447588|nr:polynucleotide adenylyltransferase PcnB [Psychrobacter sp. I-STPA10]
MAERSAKQLGLSKADLPNSIIEVIATLTKSGFDAYIVGGGVRDTLLGLSPKDFDAVTDARPHEIKDLFGKRCRIIGRRFQLAHVYSGRDMIEVATFRAPPKNEEHTTTEGMITRDNVWGDIKQDFARRDFSINAMYYQPLKGVVHDFCNALDDIKNKTLRLLGHAPLRIEEDPVRLLRALRFKAKLGFDFDKALSEQFHDDNWMLLDQVSPHRLYDESQKMFTGGYLVPLLPLLFDYGAIKHLIIYPPKAPTALVSQVAINTDRRIAQGKSINPAFFYAALLWDNYLYQLDKFKKRNMPFVEAQQQAASKVIDRQRIKTAIPKFAEQFIRDIWLMQPKLANPRVKQIAQLAEHPRFRAAFDFLLLREQCDDAANPLSESTNGMGEWWQHYQTLSDKQKMQAIDAFAGDSRRGTSKRSRGRNRNKADIQDTHTHNDNDEHLDNQQVAEAGHAGQDAKRGQDEFQAKPPKQPEQKTQPVASSRQSAQSTQSAKTMSRPQRAHYAKERAQLQQLSLDNQLAGDADNSANQPQPLFTINAQKLAKQVPNAEAADTAVTQAVIKDSQVVNVEADDANSRDNSQPKQPASKQAAAAKVTQDKSSDSSSSRSFAKELTTAKTQAVPAKRRRRMPSSEQSVNEREQGLNTVSEQRHTQQASTVSTTETKEELSQAQTHAKNNTQQSQADDGNHNSKAADLNSHKNAEPVPRKRRRKAEPSQQQKQVTEATPKQVSKKDAAATTTVQTTNTQVPQASVSGERVPAVRRRRQPSSTLSIAEREVIEQQIEQQVLGA